MQKVSTFLLSASVALFAQSTSASWSVGGFVGQSHGSSLIECQSGDFPITTLTSSVLDISALNTAINGGDAVIINEGGIFDSFQSIDSTTFFDFIASGEGVNTTETVFFGTPDIQVVSTVEPSTSFLTDLSSPETVAVFTPTDNGNFDPTDLGEFLVSTPPTSNLDALQFLSSGPTVTQSFEAFECNNDTTDVSFSLNVAYNFSKAWGIEAGYVDLGEFSSTFSASNVEVVGFPLEESFDASAVYLAATGSYYYNDKWSITGRLGIYQLDVDRTIELGGQEFTVSEDEEDFYYGVSWNYDLSNVIQFQLRYDNFDVDVFSFGVRYKLGK